MIRARGKSHAKIKVVYAEGFRALSKLIVRRASIPVPLATRRVYPKLAKLLSFVERKYTVSCAVKIIRQFV
jgi:hypothetical protein